jgi:hypothetical protein
MTPEEYGKALQQAVLDRLAAEVQTDLSPRWMDDTWAIRTKVGGHAAIVQVTPECVKDGVPAAVVADQLVTAWAHAMRDSVEQIHALEEYRALPWWRRVWVALRGVL